MTTHNSRNESKNSTANTIWKLVKAGMLAKVVKLATECREANYTTPGTLLKSEMIATAGTARTSWMSSAEGLPEQAVGKSASVEKTVCRLHRNRRYED
jgi:hypothetical protein